MGKIDNENLKLRDFVDPYLDTASQVRILTGCVSTGPIKWLLSRLPTDSTLSVIAGSIPPSFHYELDRVFVGANVPQGVVGHSFSSGRFRLGFNPEIHMKVWMLRLNGGNTPACLTISGSSNLTWAGLGRRRGEQNDCFRGSAQFSLEESRWMRFAPETRWLTKSNWGYIKNHCWNDDAQGGAKGIYTRQEKSNEEIQIIVAEFYDTPIEKLRTLNKRHPKTVLYAYKQIAVHLRKQNIPIESELIH